jgi:hydrogenase/urease accessory protein HupE
LVVFLCGLLFPNPEVSAHPLAPSLLEITERAPGQADLLWKTPAARVPGVDLKPVLPAHCLQTGKIESRRVETARTDQWEVFCSAPLVGSSVGVEGIAHAKADVLLRVVLADGRKYQSVLSAGRPSFTIPERQPSLQVFQSYLALGVEHILLGWDHLLFVLGLVLLVKGGRRLLWTLTAFTLGHSLTLSLAVLGWVKIPPEPVEAAIALSIFFLAVELTRGQRASGTFFHRYPWIIASGFGLLHGLGFAGALAQVGLPIGEIPLALFSFNVGIELGQIFFIGALWALYELWRRWARPVPLQGVRIPAYAIGSLAVFWFFERLSRL